MDSPPRVEPAPEADQWLAKLEQRVAQAAEEIARLRQENRRLERELARARKTAAPAGEGSGAWEKERTEIRGRVEKLARHLEELLGADAAREITSGGAPEAAAEASAEPDAEPAERPRRGAVQRTLEPVD